MGRSAILPLCKDFTTAPKMVLLANGAAGSTTRSSMRGKAINLDYEEVNQWLPRKRRGLSPEVGKYMMSIINTYIPA
jgi:hypothetical protein